MNVHFSRLFRVFLLSAILALTAVFAARRDFGASAASPETTVRHMLAAYERGDLTAAAQTFCDAALAYAVLPSSGPYDGSSRLSGVQVASVSGESTPSPAHSSDTVTLVQVTGTVFTLFDGAASKHALAWTVETQHQTDKWCISRIASMGW